MIERIASYACNGYRYSLWESSDDLLPSYYCCTLSGSGKPSAYAFVDCLSRGQAIQSMKKILNERQPLAGLGIYHVDS